MTITDPAAIHQAFADATNRGDLDALTALFSRDAVVIERDGARTTGAEAIRKHLQQLLAMSPKMQIHASYAFDNGDVALLCSRWSATAATPAGHTIELDFRGSEIARRDRAGGWLLYVDNPWGAELATT